MKKKFDQTKDAMIEEETKVKADRADGYGQLIDEADQNVSGGDEETKLIDPNQIPDGASSSRMGESAKVKSEEAMLKQIEDELGAFLQNHLDANKMTPAENKKKANLKRRLTEQTQKLKEERKKAEKVEQELARHAMKQSGHGDEMCNNILCPKYELNEELGWMEIDPPPKTMYKKVGYNDLTRVKEMMEGNDAEKRAGTKRVTQKRMTSGTAMRAKDEEAAQAQEELDRKLEITNLHYRRFFDDELENNAELFPSMPFLSVPIKRGQSRGLKKSWFSVFGADKTDESGQVSNEKQVGYFKGRIRVYNEAEEQAYKAEKAEKMSQIMELIKNVHQKTFKQPWDIELEQIMAAGAEET